MKTTFRFLLLLSLVLSASAAPAQILDIRRAVKNKIINKVNNNIDNAIDKQLNKAENAIVDSINKKNGVDKGAVRTDTVKADSPTASADSNTAAPQATPTLQTYSKYDFIPGEKVIFFDDFSQGETGDFPALWNTNGSGEIVSTNLFPGRWFQINGEGFYIPDTKGDFPDNFTVEFDWVTLVTPEKDGINLGFYIVSGDIKDPSEGGAIPGKAGNKISIAGNSASFSAYSNGEYGISGSKDFPLKENTLYHMSFWVQKQRIRMYINEAKVFDVPRGMPEGYRWNILRFEMGDECSPLIGNFRVAAGLPDMRNKLLTDGKMVTYGINFDTNSDKVKPESYGTLKGIAAILTENAGLRVKIIGHTDADGADAANLDLSKRRAASVKNELVKTFSIDASRLETDGKGESAPVAPNDTPTNKALNRRVELIKL